MSEYGHGLVLGVEAMVILGALAVLGILLGAPL